MNQQEEQYNESATPLIDSGEYNHIEKKHHPINLNITQLKEVRDILNDGVCTMVVCNLLAHPTVSYSRDKSRTIPKKYNKHQYSTYKIIKAIDRLEELGYVYNHISEYVYNADVEEIQQSYVEATPLLHHHFGKKGKNVTKSQKNYTLDTQVILLKDKTGKLVDYTDNVMTREARKIIQDYNKAASDHDIALDGVKFDVILRSHYKEDFSSYGRLFAMGNSHQNLKKKERTRLTINGEATAECDYRNLHLKMIIDHYKLWDYVSDDNDLYSLPLTKEQQKNPENRPLIKLMVMTLLNNKSRWESIRAFNYKVMKEDISLGDFHSGENVMQAIERGLPFIFGNPQIMQNMYSSVRPMAAFLQNLDSKICKDVIRCCKEMNVFVLPVHDSFITKLSDADIVGKVMGDSYRRIMGTRNIVACSVTVDGNTWNTTY